MSGFGVRDIVAVSNAVEEEEEMPPFMDVHNLGEVSMADVAAAHQADLAAQDEHGVNYLRYWVDEEHGKVFYLVDACYTQA